jgi:uncharacterized protein (TIGR03067 family)
MSRTVLTCLLGLTAAGAQPPAGDIGTELTRHQGVWAVTSFVREGKEAPQDVAHAIVREVKGDHVVWKRDGKNFAGTTVVLDPKAVPHAIDVIPDGGPARDQHVLGIYRLEGDTLTICMADADRPRPTRFEAPPERHQGELAPRRVP